MENRVLYVGLDVDDAAFHGAIFDPIRNAIRTFACRPTVKGLTNQLERHSKLHPDASIRICYEATYNKHGSLTITSQLFSLFN